MDSSGIRRKGSLTVSHYDNLQNKNHKLIYTIIHSLNNGITIKQSQSSKLIKHINSLTDAELQNFKEVLSNTINELDTSRYYNDENKEELKNLLKKLNGDSDKLINSTNNNIIFLSDIITHIINIENQPFTSNLFSTTHRTDEGRYHGGEEKGEGWRLGDRGKSTTLSRDYTPDSKAPPREENHETTLTARIPTTTINDTEYELTEASSEGGNSLLDSLKKMIPESQIKKITLPFDGKKIEGLALLKGKLSRIAEETSTDILLETDTETLICPKDKSNILKGNNAKNFAQKNSITAGLYAKNSVTDPKKLAGNLAFIRVPGSAEPSVSETTSTAEIQKDPREETPEQQKRRGTILNGFKTIISSRNDIENRRNSQEIKNINNLNRIKRVSVDREFFGNIDSYITALENDAQINSFLDETITEYEKTLLQIDAEIKFTSNRSIEMRLRSDAKIELRGKLVRTLARLHQQSVFLRKWALKKGAKETIELNKTIIELNKTIKKITNTFLDKSGKRRADGVKEYDFHGAPAPSPSQVKGSFDAEDMQYFYISMIIGASNQNAGSTINIIPGTDDPRAEKRLYTNVTQAIHKFNISRAAAGKTTLTSYDHRSLKIPVATPTTVDDLNDSSISVTNNGCLILWKNTPSPIMSPDGSPKGKDAKKSENS